MAVTAEAVKLLRERTGAGMMECKKALVETNGDLDAAAELMRKAGLAKADKKAARVAAEGVIVIERSADAKRAAIVEVNCETDFVARENDFQAVRGRRRQGGARAAVRRSSMRCSRRRLSGGQTRRRNAPCADREDRREHRRASFRAGRGAGGRRVRICTARASARWSR